MVAVGGILVGLGVAYFLFLAVTSPMLDRDSNTAQMVFTMLGIGSLLGLFVGAVTIYSGGSPGEKRRVRVWMHGVCGIMLVIFSWACFSLYYASERVVSWYTGIGGAGLALEVVPVFVCLKYGSVVVAILGMIPCLIVFRDFVQEWKEEKGDENAGSPES